MTIKWTCRNVGYALCCATFPTRTDKILASFKLWYLTLKRVADQKYTGFICSFHAHTLVMTDSCQSHSAPFLDIILNHQHLHRHCNKEKVPDKITDFLITDAGFTSGLFLITCLSANGKRFVLGTDHSVLVCSRQAVRLQEMLISQGIRRCFWGEGGGVTSQNTFWLLNMGAL